MDGKGEADEWTVVTRRSSASRNSSSSNAPGRASGGQTARNKSKKNGPSSAGIADACCKLDVDFDLESTYIEIVTDLVPKLQDSSFLKACLTELQNCCYERIVALGIGRCNNPSSKLQTAFLCCLVKDLLERNSRADATADLICTVIDPIYTEKDISLCSRLGFSVERVSTRGKISPESASIKTLYYMPHCPYRLYCNVTWSHRNHCENALILGNSFDSYLIRRAARSDPADVLRLLQSAYIEKGLWHRAFASRQLHNLENAFIETSLMRLTPDAASVCWPTEEDIDAASAADIELL